MVRLTPPPMLAFSKIDRSTRSDTFPGRFLSIVKSLDIAKATLVSVGKRLLPQTRGIFCWVFSGLYTPGSAFLERPMRDIFSMVLRTSRRAAQATRFLRRNCRFLGFFFWPMCVCKVPHVPPVHMCFWLTQYPLKGPVCFFFFPGRLRFPAFFRQLTLRNVA